MEHFLPSEALPRGFTESQWMSNGATIRHIRDRVVKDSYYVGLILGISVQPSERLQVSLEFQRPFFINEDIVLLALWLHS